MEKKIEVTIMGYIGLYQGYIRVLLGLHWGHMGLVNTELSWCLCEDCSQPPLSARASSHM